MAKVSMVAVALIGATSSAQTAVAVLAFSHSHVWLHAGGAQPFLGQIMLQFLSAAWPTLQFQDSLKLVKLQAKASFASYLIIVGLLPAMGLGKIGLIFRCQGQVKACFLASMCNQVVKGLGQLGLANHQQQLFSSSEQHVWPISQLPKEMASAAMSHD